MVRPPTRTLAAARAEITEARPMSSKFAEFLEKNKIDARRLIAASRKVEQLRPEDRAVKLAKRQAKAGGEKKEGAPQKPRSGRPVTPRAITAAQAGKTLTGPAKTRLVRAVNYLLSQKKAEPVELRKLF